MKHVGYHIFASSKDMEPELVCVDGYGKKAGMGVLEDGGYVFNVSLNTVRKLLSKECVLLHTLGKNIPFEIAVGMNGRIWIRQDYFNIYITHRPSHHLNYGNKCVQKFY